jgi:uncharacterized membrane protein YcaP (DUF421 family)
LHGLERIDQIKYAILEATGHITIVPITIAPPDRPDRTRLRRRER